MFSVAQKRDISEKIQKVLREGEITFAIHVSGEERWSWADIQNNGAVSSPDVNPHNEKSDPLAR